MDNSNQTRSACLPRWYDLTPAVGMGTYTGRVVYNIFKGFGNKKIQQPGETPRDLFDVCLIGLYQAGPGMFMLIEGWRGLEKFLS